MSERELRRRVYLLIGLILQAVICCGAPTFLRAGELELINAAMNSIQADGLKKHTLFLASDTLEGREAGSKGGHAAGAYLLDIMKKSGLKARGDSGYFTQEFGDDYRNLLAYLPGDVPQLADEFIVVGAHYDHVGYGNSQNSFGPIGQIHNGADDNASGVAAVVEVIKALTRQPLKLKRPILIAFWDAEEKGLLGSEYWIDTPTIPLTSVGLYLNLDMIGRLPKQGLTMYGVRTAPGFRQFIAEQNRVTDIDILFDWTIKRDSDHHPFYENKIPFLMPHTGLHDDYHRPSDDPEKLNWNGMEQISRLFFQMIVAAADAESLPQFRSESKSENTTVQMQMSQPAPPAPPRLGISWNRELEEQGIIEIEQVRRDSPAERSGMRAGDRIQQINGTELPATTSFLRLVSRANNPVEFVLKRPGEAEPQTVTAELDGPPVRLGVGWRIDPAEPGVISLVRIDAGSPADDAGLSAGDRISQIAGVSIRDSRHFAELVAASSGSVEMLRERKGRLQVVTVIFDDDPAEKLSEAANSPKS
ncbi:MAG: M20/M25/M40 family metallo-hydrolase [Planctomycetota bacterium]|nr:M20/M25/M40 family metallo-hydrolase [Planctomycetota bacterium]